MVPLLLALFSVCLVGPSRCGGYISEAVDGLEEPLPPLIDSLVIPEDDFSADRGLDKETSWFGQSDPAGSLHLELPRGEGASGKALERAALGPDWSVGTQTDDNEVTEEEKKRRNELLEATEGADVDESSTGRMMAGDFVRGVGNAAHQTSLSRPGHIVAVPIVETVCPGLVCFALPQAEPKETSLLDCQPRRPTVGGEGVHNVACRYWLRYERANWLRREDVMRIAEVKLVLRPEEETEAVDDLEESSAAKRARVRVRVHQMAPGLLGRLLGHMRAHLNLPSVRPDGGGASETVMLHLTISYLHFNRLGGGDLAGLVSEHGLSSLSLWNPDVWEAESWLAETNNQTGRDGMTLEASAGVYFQLTVFCETVNRDSAFQHLWLPWRKWRIKFNHCNDVYSCRRWRLRYPICSEEETTASSATDYWRTKAEYLVVPETPSGDPDFLALLERSRRTGDQMLYYSQCREEAEELEERMSKYQLNKQMNCLRPVGRSFVAEAEKTSAPSSEAVSTQASGVTRLATEWISTPPPSEPVTMRSLLAVATTEASVDMTPEPIGSASPSMLPGFANAARRETDVANPVGQTKTRQTQKEHPPVVTTVTSVAVRAKNVRRTTTPGPSEAVDRGNITEPRFGQADAISDLSAIRLTYGIIMLGAFNLLLLSAFCLLFVWIHRRLKRRRKPDASKFLKPSQASTSAAMATTTAKSKAMVTVVTNSSPPALPARPKRLSSAEAETAAAAIRLLRLRAPCQLDKISGQLPGRPARLCRSALMHSQPGLSSQPALFETRLGPPDSCLGPTARSGYMGTLGSRANDRLCASSSFHEGGPLASAGLFTGLLLDLDGPNHFGSSLVGHDISSSRVAVALGQRTPPPDFPTGQTSLSTTPAWRHVALSVRGSPVLPHLGPTHRLDCLNPGHHEDTASSELPSFTAALATGLEHHLPPDTATETRPPSPPAHKQRIQGVKPPSFSDSRRHLPLPGPASQHQHSRSQRVPFPQPASPVKPLQPMSRFLRRRNLNTSCTPLLLASDSGQSTSGSTHRLITGPNNEISREDDKPTNTFAASKAGNRTSRPEEIWNRPDLRLTEPKSLAPDVVGTRVPWQQVGPSSRGPLLFSSANQMACSASTSSLSESSDFTNAPGGNLRFLSCNGDQVLLLTESVIEASDPAPLSFSLASERLTRSQTNASSDGTTRDRPTTPPSSPPPLVFQKPLPPEPTHQDATAFANAAGTNVADKASFRWPYNWLMSAFRPDAGKEATQQRMQTSQDTQQGLLFTSTSSSSASTSSSRSAPFSADLPNGKSEFGLGSPYESGLTPVGDNDQPPTPVAIALASKIIAAAKPSAEGSRRRPHDSSDMIGRPSLCAKQTLEAVYGYNHKVPHTLVISRQDDAPMSGAEFERRTRWNR